jgi:hypothetical protein
MKKVPLTETPLKLKTTDEIKKLGLPVTAAVFNLGGGDGKHFRGPFLDIPLSAFQSHWESQVYFAHSTPLTI